MEMYKIIKRAKDHCKASSAVVYQIKFINFVNRHTVSELTNFDQWNSKVYEFMSPVSIRPGDIVLCLVKPETTDATITIGKCVGSKPIGYCVPRTLAVNTGFILCKMDIEWFTDIMQQQQQQQNLEPMKKDIIARKGHVISHMSIRDFMRRDSVLANMVNRYTKAGGAFGDLQ